MSWMWKKCILNAVFETGNNLKLRYDFRDFPEWINCSNLDLSHSKRKKNIDMKFIPCKSFCHASRQMKGPFRKEKKTKKNDKKRRFCYEKWSDRDFVLHLLQRVNCFELYPLSILWSWHSKLFLSLQSLMWKNCKNWINLKYTVYKNDWFSKMFNELSIEIIL